MKIMPCCMHERAWSERVFCLRKQKELQSCAKYTRDTIKFERESSKAMMSMNANYNSGECQTNPILKLSMVENKGPIGPVTPVHDAFDYKINDIAKKNQRINK
ncbi:hypothetical protein Dimus_012664 [Dionaea muscipula]